MRQGQHSSTGGSSKFFSLKWKVGLIVSLVLIFINSLITVAVYRQSNLQFNEQKLALLHQQQRMMSGLLQRDYEQLTSFASFIPLLSGSADADNAASSLSGILERHSALLGLEWGIQALSFFNAPGQRVYSWAGEAHKASHLRLARQAAQIDGPTGWIECVDDCVLTLALPQLEGTLRGGILVLSRSVADGVLEFHRLSGSEAAILVVQPARGEPMAGTARRYLSDWGVDVPALSHPSLTFGVLQALQRNYALAELTQEPAFVEHDGQWYACLLRYDEAAGEGTAFLVVSPVSEDLAQLASANRMILTAGIVGLLVTGSVLMMFLWKPMRRIRQIVGALPYLGRSDFS